MGGGCTVDGDCFYSPNYPEDYGNHATCTITALADGNLTVVDFAVESHSACGCDYFTVTLCPGLLGKDAFHGMRSVGQNSRPLFCSIKFPTNITNSTAFAYAAFQHGGRDHEHLPDYCLSCANFPKTSEADMDNFVPPKDYKLESRPRHATTPQQWAQDAKREAWAWACFYGQEHYDQQVKAAEQLLTMNDEEDYAWPPNIIFGIWAELRGRWCEELLHKTFKEPRTLQ